MHRATEEVEGTQGRCSRLPPADQGQVTASRGKVLEGPRTRKPCAKIFLGMGSPADMSMPGQYTAWKRRMSLPTKCTSAGHPHARSSSSAGSTPSGRSAAKPRPLRAYSGSRSGQASTAYVQGLHRRPRRHSRPRSLTSQVMVVLYYVQLYARPSSMLGQHDSSQR